MQTKLIHAVSRPNQYLIHLSPLKLCKNFHTQRFFALFCKRRLCSCSLYSSFSSAAKASPPASGSWASRGCAEASCTPQTFGLQPFSFIFVSSLTLHRDHVLGDDAFVVTFPRHFGKRSSRGPTTCPGSHLREISCSYAATADRIPESIDDCAEYAIWCLNFQISHVPHSCPKSATSAPVS